MKESPCRPEQLLECPASWQKWTSTNSCMGSSSCCRRAFTLVSAAASYPFALQIVYVLQYHLSGLASLTIVADSGVPSQIACALHLCCIVLKLHTVHAKIQGTRQAVREARCSFQILNKPIAIRHYQHEELMFLCRRIRRAQQQEQQGHNLCPPLPYTGAHTWSHPGQSANQLQ